MTYKMTSIYNTEVLMQARKSSVECINLNLKSVPVDYVNLLSQIQNCIYSMLPFHAGQKIYICIWGNDLYITSSNNLLTSFQYEFKNSQPYENWAYQFMLNSTRWPLLELNTLYYEDLSIKV